jgi:hypothetical protein
MRVLLILCGASLALLLLTMPLAAQAQTPTPTITATWIPPTPTLGPTGWYPTATPVFTPMVIPTLPHKDFRDTPTPYPIVINATVVKAFKQDSAGVNAFADTIINTYKAANIPVIQLAGGAYGIVDVVVFIFLSMVALSYAYRIGRKLGA